MYNRTICELPNTKSVDIHVSFLVSLIGYRTYGVPTIRSDLRAPKIKRVCDTKNYGDESDAYGLVNPSIFSRRGVQEKDFLLPRTKEEVSFIPLVQFLQNTCT